MNQTLELLMDHRSIRKFKPDAVPDTDILAAVEAGQMASTSSAVQAYSLIRIRDAGTRARLADLTGPQPKVAESGAFFVVCADSRRHRLACERDGGQYDQGLEAFLVGVIDASLFAEKMVIAFESMGYGVCYIGGLRNDIKAVDALLGLPGGVYPLYGLCVGVPDESPSVRPRLDAGCVLFEERYPDDAEVLERLAAYDRAYEAYLRERGAPDTTPWSVRMGRKYVTRSREDLAAYYRSKGADLS